MSQVVQDSSRRMRSGIGKIHSGDPEGAAGEFSALLAEGRRDAEVLNNLAVAYRRQDRLQDALGSILEAIELNPSRAEYQYNLGKIYRGLGNFKSSAMAFARAVESDPGLIPAYVNLGASHYLLRDWAKAELFLRMGLSKEAGNPVLAASHAAALAAKERGGPGDLEALEEADDILVSPETPVEAAGDPLSLEKIRGMLLFFRGFAASLPTGGPEFSGGLGAAVDRLVAALGPGGAFPEAAPEAPGVAETRGEETAAGGTAFPGLVKVLVYMERLADHLPETEERDRLVSRVDSVIRELREVTS